MAEYTADDLALIVRYDGTKEAFEAVKSDYLGKVVFIYGSKTEVANQAGLVQSIWVSDANGGRYLDMANVEYISNNLTHISGITVDGRTYYPSSGGGAITLVGANGIAVTVNTTTGAVTFNGETLKNNLIGTSTNGSDTSTYPDTIKGAKAYTDKVAGDLKGKKADGDTTAETIRGAKDYADKVAASKASTAKDEAIQASKNYVDPLLANKADLEKGKIKESQLPDYIFGQMLFGGTITAGGANTMEVLPSSKLLDKVDKPSTTSSLTINKTDASTYEGAYFIVTNNLPSIFGFPTNTGDWIVSTGVDWRKVDNTDAIVKVAGVTPVNGDIDASDLAKKLAETGDANELALKSEVDAKYTKPDGGIPETDLAGDVVEKIKKGKTSVQSVSGGDFISVTDTSATTNNKSYEISAKTKTLEQAKVDILLNGEDALATAHDVYNFIKARLSVKVVS